MFSIAYTAITRPILNIPAGPQTPTKLREQYKTAVTSFLAGGAFLLDQF